MNLGHRFILPLAVMAALQTLGMAQQPPAPSAVPSATLLPVNYRVTLANREGDKPVGALSNLTCSPHVHVSGNIDAFENLASGNRIPISCEVKGDIQDEDGIITFTYHIGMQIPVPSQRLTNGPQSVATTIQYKDVRCSGTLQMKPGKTYAVFQTGGRTLSISITPERDS